MLEMQFWLMALGFLLLGFAVGDKLYSYFPKNTKRNKLSIFIVPTILGGLVLSVPILGLFGSPVSKGVINSQALENNIKQIDEYIKTLKLKMVNNISNVEKDQILDAIQMLENQKRQIEVLTTYNFNLFLACGLCVFTGSFVSIILGRRNESHE